MSARYGFFRNNGLTLAFFALFVLALIGQAFSGLAAFNAYRRANLEPAIDLWTYVTSSDFAVDVAENWQSEYLQFTLFILLTVWLVQRGSPESKTPGDEGTESDEQQHVGEHAKAASPKLAKIRDWRGFAFSNSLGFVMAGIFLLSWLAQAIAGGSAYSAERLANLQDPIPFPQYVLTADFWDRTLQNWQSEMLAVASMVIFAVYLRQRGSPESKPVGAPDSETAVQG